MSDDKGLRGRVTRQGQEAIGKVTQGMLDNPVVNKTLSTAFETRERASRAQELAMSAGLAASMLTPGTTAPDTSLTTPAMFAVLVP